jgi:hypothetical protein
VPNAFGLTVFETGDHEAIITLSVIYWKVLQAGVNGLVNWPCPTPDSNWRLELLIDLSALFHKLLGFFLHAVLQRLGFGNADLRGVIG